MSTTQTPDPIQKLLEAKERHVLTLREISIAIDLTEKAVWSLVSNGSQPRAGTKSKILAYVKSLDDKLAKEKADAMKRYEGIILDHIYDGVDGRFWAVPKPGTRKYSQAIYPTGVARTDRWYHDLVKACDIVGDDKLLLSVLNLLAQTGRLKIIGIWVPKQRPMSSGEGILMKFILGEAVRELPAQDTVFKITRLFRDKPLDSAEMIGRGVIRDPKTAILNIRRARERSFKARFGASGIDAEIREYKEKVRDEAELRIAQKGGGKMSKRSEDFDASEYDSTAHVTVEKVRQFYEKKIKNERKSPQVFYNADDGQRVTIEPGETKIVIKCRRLKPLPVETKIKE